MRVNYCGLYWASLEEVLRPNWRWTFVETRFVALKDVQVEAVLVETSAEVKIVQKYFNHQSFPIEAMYVFPIDEHAAVCEFEAEIRGRRIVGTVKSKSQATTEYNQAVRRGDGAYLLEQEKADVFRAKIGNIPPGEEVTISIKYVTELKNELEKLRFVLPTYVAPRYSPVGQFYTGSTATVGQGSGYSKLNVNITCVSMVGFDGIESPSHPILTSINGTYASVGLQGAANLDKDFVLLVSYQKPHEPKVVLEGNDKGDYAAMISLFPHLEFADAKTELIFVVDRSGSMQSKVKELREALHLFMRSLPEDCFFNIIGFGSSFTKLMESSRRYTDETLEIATKHINTLGADMGGTEIYRPLEYVYRQPLIPGYSRQVFLLTDGQVSNNDQVISLVQKNNISARTFALGIGDSVSHALVEGVARAGKGTSAFALEGERIEKKVLKQLKDATQPALSNVKVDWGMKTSAPAGPPVGSKVLSLVNYVSPAVTEKPTKIQQAPFQVPPLYSDNHFRIYAIFSTPKLPEKISISAMSPDGLLQLELPLEPEKMIRGNLLHTLAARSLIRDLEEGSSYLHGFGGTVPQHVLQEEIISLGIKYGLASKFTSFLAIEERSPPDRWFDCYAPVFVPVPVSVAPSHPVYYTSGAPFQARSSAPSMAPIPQAAFFASGSGGGGVEMKKKEASSRSMSSSRSISSNSYAEAKSFDSFSFPGGPPPPPARAPMPNAFFASPPAPPPSQPHQAYSASFAPPPPPPGASFRESESLNFPQTSSASVFMDVDSSLEKEESKSRERSEVPVFDLLSDSLPSSLPAPSKPGQDSRSLLVGLLQLQSSKGAFALTSQLGTILGVPLSKLQETLQQFRGKEQIDEATLQLVWATVLALMFLNKKCADLSDEWELAANKSKKWLTSLKLQSLPTFNTVAATLL